MNKHVSRRALAAGVRAKTQTHRHARLAPWGLCRSSGQSLANCAASKRGIPWFAVVIAVAVVGCQRSAYEVSDDLGQRAAVTVSPRVLDEYAGVYRLPSGALFRVTREGEHLYGGTPPSRLYAQTTRQFTSNRFFGDIRFDRDAKGNVHRLDYRQAKRSHWCDRVDPRENPDPTQLVDAGGFQLRMLKLGQGFPAIVLEDGFGNGIELQFSLQSALSSVSSVIAYDHAGTGGSDRGPEPRNAQQVARELRIALANANVQPPFILVGGSIGGDYCRVFAREHPADVAALVLLDPTPDWEHLLEWAEANSPQRVEDYRRLIHETGDAMEMLMRHQEAGRLAEWQQLDASRRQARQALPLLHIPIIQVTGSVGQLWSFAADDKVRFFDAWLKKHIPHAQHVLAANSGHAVSMTDQDLVVDQVRRLVEELRGQ